MRITPSIENRHGFHPSYAGNSVALTNDGLVCGAGSILARMTASSGRQHLALEADEDRLVALLSVIDGTPLKRETVLPHIATAAGHWQRGDKALANLRLVFAGLPKIVDHNAARRLKTAEELLDDGLSPVALMKALWPEPTPDGFGKYAPDQPRVPAGNARGGEWLAWADVSQQSAKQPDGAFTIAMDDETRDRRDEKDAERREILGVETPDDDLAHHHAIEPPHGLRGGGNTSVEAPIKPAITLELSQSRFGEATEHMSDAQDAGIQVF